MAYMECLGYIELFERVMTDPPSSPASSDPYMFKESNNPNSCRMDCLSQDTSPKPTYIEHH